LGRGNIIRSVALGGLSLLAACPAEDGDSMPAPTTEGSGSATTEADTASPVESTGDTTGAQPGSSGETRETPLDPIQI
jgi:hypothetical protein